MRAWSNTGSYDLNRNVHRITLYNTIAAEHQHKSMRRRLYLHMDMNCFYAQVEQLSYNLYGIPLIVGGWRKENGTARGIVATSSYEARAFGIKTGMSAFEAQQICPYIVFMQVHYEKYQAISREIDVILKKYSPDVEAYSMDEYFLDITFMLKRPKEEIIALGNRIKNEIYQKTGLVCSVGISFTKTYAKLASDLRKPNGLTAVLTGDDARTFIYPLSLNEVWGIGSRRYKKLKQAGIRTIEDAIHRGKGAFQNLFGDYFGKMLYETATGHDRAMVMSHIEHIPREVAYMHTFSDWTTSIDEVSGEITKAVRQLCYRMRGYGRRADKFTGYIRFQDETWKGVSFSFITPGYTNLNDYILGACLETALPLLKRFLGEGYRIRGIGLHTVEMDESNQLDLFFQEDDKLKRRYLAVDAINNRYGLNTIMPASQRYDVPGKTHFLDRNH
jgi:DNA polymerase-4